MKSFFYVSMVTLILLGAGIFTNATAATEIEPGTPVGEVSSGDYQITKPGLHEGAFKFNGGTLTQTNGTIHPNAGWMTLGQNGSPTWTLSGNAKAYLTYGTERMKYAFCVATTVSAASSPTMRILPNSSARFYAQEVNVGSFGTYEDVHAVFSQASGEFYTPYFRVRDDSSNVVTASYDLSGGTFVVGQAGGLRAVADSGTAQSPALNFTGGTLGFGTWTGDLENKGGTVEVYGNVLTALDQTNYTFAKFEAGTAPDFTTYGTANVTGNFTQSSGTLALDYDGSTNADKLTTAGTVTLSDGEIYIRTPMNAKIENGLSFDGLDGTTITNNATIRSSAPGWNWTLDSATGTFTTTATAIPTSMTDNLTIGDGDSYYTTATTYFSGTNQTITQTGGVWTVNSSAGSVYLGSNGNNVTVNQSGGIFNNAYTGNSAWLVLNESSGDNTTVWNMSGDAKFYSQSESKVIIGKSKLGQFTVKDNAVMHIKAAKLGTNISGTKDGVGEISQNGGEVYLQQLDVFHRHTGSSYGDVASGITLTSGRLVVNEIVNTGTGTIASKIDLNGGTFSVAQSAVSLTNRGSQIEILGNVANTLADFSYLNDGNDVTDRPVGFTDIGTMNVTGSFVQESGSIVFDIANDTLSYDSLTANSIAFNGGDLFIEYEGDEADLVGKTFPLFTGATFGPLFDTLVTNQAGTLFWQLSANGAVVSAAPSVPEPTSWILFVMGVGMLLRRKMRF